MMTTKQADRIIKNGKPGVVKLVRFPGVEITITIVKRDRWTVTGSNGERFERSDLEGFKV